VIFGRNKIEETHARETKCKFFEALLLFFGLGVPPRFIRNLHRVCVPHAPQARADSILALLWMTLAAIPLRIANLKAWSAVIVQHLRQCADDFVQQCISSSRFSLTQA